VRTPQHSATTAREWTTVPDAGTQARLSSWTICSPADSRVTPRRRPLRVSLRDVKLLVMVAVALALAFGGAGVAYRFVHDRADSLVHQVVDTDLPSRVQEHPWTPVVRHHPVPGSTIRFGAGTVDTVRCHLDLGSYSLSIVHGFGFQRSVSRIRPGCPGSMVRRALSTATKVRSDTSGSHEVLRFVNDAGRTVLTLRARG